MVAARAWGVDKPAVRTPNLHERQCSPTKRHAAWVTDITCIRPWQGWPCLAVVIDVFSRKGVGWAAGPTIHRELVLNALASAVKQRRPRGTIIDSDQSVQFGSDARRRFCIDTFYIRSRRHSYLGAVSPAQSEGTRQRRRRRKGA